MFILREVKQSDLDDIYQLSELLKLSSNIYFYNLPHNKELLSQGIDLSIRSFANELESLLQGHYIFVLEDGVKKKIIGTSMIVAQHGTPDSPHQFFKVKKIEKFSESIHIGFIHEILEYGYDSNGPTEIGGLVLDPSYRRVTEHLGKQLSYIRFLYIAMNKACFRNQILAELQPPLVENGKSALWEAIGRRFTNLSYQEADELSRKNKEFIISLFPEGNIYTCLLKTSARSAIGKINLNTLPVKYMLEKIGFQYLNMIDPFDGGPHYGANLSDITLIQQCMINVPVQVNDNVQYCKSGLIAVQSPKGLISVQSQISLQENSLFMPSSTFLILNKPSHANYLPYL